MGIKLVGIAGKARSGKDTLADILMNDHGFEKMPMAFSLKTASAPLFAWPLARVFEDDFKTFHDDYWGFTVREGYQRLGDAMKREFGDDFWARLWEYNYAGWMDKVSVVVPDIRFECEAKAIRKLGGVVVHLSRDGAGLQGHLGLHSSESGIEMGSKDVTIKNNGSIADLACEAHKLIMFIEEHAVDFGLRNVMQEV